jgi:hypothetical protein
MWAHRQTRTLAFLSTQALFTDSCAVYKDEDTTSAPECSSASPNFYTINGHSLVSPASDTTSAVIRLVGAAVKTATQATNFRNVANTSEEELARFSDHTNPGLS